MSRMLTGLCVGGPLDGKVLSYDHNVYRCVRKRLLPTFSPFPVFGDHERQDNLFTYGWHPGIRFFATEWTHGFWLDVHDPKQDVKWALEHIFKGYAESRGSKRYPDA